MGPLREKARNRPPALSPPWLVGLLLATLLGLETNPAGKTRTGLSNVSLCKHILTESFPVSVQVEPIVSLPVFVQVEPIESLPVSVRVDM